MSIIDIYIVVFSMFFSVFLSAGTLKRFTDFSNFSGLSTSLGNLQIIRSIFAQYISSFTLLSILQYVYLSRMQFILAMIGEIISFFLVYFLFSKRILKNNKKSIHELIGYYYGGDIRFLFACGELLSNAFFIAAHFKLITEILKIFKFSQISCNLILFILAIVVIIYASFEESKTNYFNVFIEFSFFLLIPFICIYFWNNVCFLSTLDNINIFELNKMSFRSCFSAPEVTFVTIALLLRFLVPFCDSTGYHSMIICKGKKADRLFCLSGFFIAFYFFLMMMLGVFLYISNPMLNNNDIFAFFFKNLPIGIKGLFLSTVIVLTFSSCVKTVQSLSVILLNDIVPCEKLFINRNEFKNIVVSNISIVLLIFLVSLSSLDYFTIFLYGSVGIFPISVVTTSLTLSGVRAHKNCVYASVISGVFGTLVATLVLLNTSYCKYCFFPGFICSSLGFIFTHIYYKYIVGYKWNGIEPEDLDKQKEMALLKSKIEVSLNKSKSNLALLIRNTMKDENIYDLSDAEIIKKYITNPMVRSSLEYKLFKGYVFKYIINKSCDINDPNLDQDKDFIKYINSLL